QLTRGTFQVKPGSLFPALQRMKENGWITSSVGKSETNRDAKYYKLTKAGRRQLESETEQWERVAAAIAWVLQAGEESHHRGHDGAGHNQNPIFTTETRRHGVTEKNRGNQVKSKNKIKT